MVVLSIVIVNWNGKELLEKCLASIFGNNPPISYEVFVVDNGSSDGSVPMVEEEFPHVQLIKNDQNLGFARANNQAIRKSQGRYILLLNNDIEVLSGALEGMVEFMDGNPSAGACCGKLFFPDMTHQVGFNVVRFPRLVNAFVQYLWIDRFWPSNPFTKRFLMMGEDYNKVLSVDQPAGACLMVRKEVVDTVGLLDEEFFILFDDVDWCWRIKKAGWKIYFLPHCHFLHHWGASFKRWLRDDLWLTYTDSLDYYYRKNRGGVAFFLLRAIVTINSLVKCLRLIPRLALGPNRRRTVSLLFSYWRICMNILTGKRRLRVYPAQL